MAINYERLLNRTFAPVEHTYSAQDSILYALALGLGDDPLDQRQLAFVYEQGQRAFPTLPMILGYPGFWAREADTGIDWRRLVHAEQSLQLHAPLPAHGRVMGHSRITAIVDKGPEKGALLYLERRVVDAESGVLLATVNQVNMLRGDGGFGGPSGPVPTPHRLPDRAPDQICDLPTSPQAAMLYRLCGDDNPLHIDPSVARDAGFERPILHGLCTLGIAAHGLLRTLLDYQAERLASLRVRFTAPFYPGETLRCEFWQDGDEISLRASSLERGVQVLGAGLATLNNSQPHL